MNRCQKCNTELPVEASFCSQCGFSQSKEVTLAEGNLRYQVSDPLLPKVKQNGLTPAHTPIAHRGQHRQNKRPSFWITTFLMVCLIGGLGAYIVSTYTTRATLSPIHTVTTSENPQPVLNLQGPLSATIKQGQTLILHGEHFAPNDSILFMLDSSLPIQEKNNKMVSAQASSMGSFTVSIPVQGSGWSAGPHYIQAVDNHAKQDAYLNIVVSPISALETTSQNLALSVQGKPVKALIIHEVVGQTTPDQQQITLTNTSGSALSWTATASADHNLAWLVIDNNHTAGNLDSNGTDTIDISALITALKSNRPANPYTGQIVFIINGNEQLTLPVQLQLTDAQPEIVLSPNPAITVLEAGNTCQATTFTLINIGNTFVSWSLVPYNDTKNHVQFISNGQPLTQGTLAISGEADDTQLLSIQCTGVSAGSTYKFTMYSGNTSLPVTIFVQ